MPKYVALVSYLGTRYCGWQVQERSPQVQETIQEVLETKLRILLKTPVRVIGSGRTDAGVHASGQVFHFQTAGELGISFYKFKYSLNCLLPWDIRILSLQACPDDFHAQRDAFKKQYSYYFAIGPVELPQLKNWTLWIRKDLDVAALQKSLHSIEGKHDFKPFCASGSTAKTTEREIFEATLTRVPIPFPYFSPSEYSLVRFTLVGNGFLKQMVRSLTGTLLLIAQKKAPPDHFRTILKTQERALTGPTVLAKGLWLERVWYKDFAFDPSLTSPGKFL